MTDRVKGLTNKAEPGPTQEAHETDKLSREALGSSILLGQQTPYGKIIATGSFYQRDIVDENGTLVERIIAIRDITPLDEE